MQDYSSFLFNTAEIRCDVDRRRQIRDHYKEAAGGSRWRFDQGYSGRRTTTERLLGCVWKCIWRTWLIDSYFLGTAPTGRRMHLPYCLRSEKLLIQFLAHIGYFVPLTKIADFLRAGVHVRPVRLIVHRFVMSLAFKVTILLAGQLYARNASSDFFFLMAHCFL